MNKLEQVHVYLLIRNVCMKAFNETSSATLTEDLPKIIADAANEMAEEALKEFHNELDG